MGKLLKISVDCGYNDKFSFVLPQEEVSKMTSLTTTLGAKDSMEIEGENMDRIIPIPNSNLPTEMLVTS